MNLELVDELRAASTKLNYLIGLCDQQDENKHRQVIQHQLPQPRIFYQKERNVLLTGMN